MTIAVAAIVIVTALVAPAVYSRYETARWALNDRIKFDFGQGEPVKVFCDAGNILLTKMSCAAMIRHKGRVFTYSSELTQSQIGWVGHVKVVTFGPQT